MLRMQSWLELKFCRQWLVRRYQHIRFHRRIKQKTLATAVYVKTPSGEQEELDPQHLYQCLLLMGVGDIPLAELDALLRVPRQSLY